MNLQLFMAKNDEPIYIRIGAVSEKEAALWNGMRIEGGTFFAGRCSMKEDGEPVQYRLFTWQTIGLVDENNKYVFKEIES